MASLLHLRGREKEVAGRQSSPLVHAVWCVPVLVCMGRAQDLRICDLPTSKNSVALLGHSCFFHLYAACMSKKLEGLFRKLDWSSEQGLLLPVNSEACIASARSQGTMCPIGKGA